MSSEASADSTTPLASKTSLPRVRLRVLKGADAGAQVVSVNERLVVGSFQGVELHLSDPTVSRFHLEITPEEGAIRLRDLGSRNGTRVNGVRVHEGWVEPGVHIQVGESVLLLEVEPGQVDADVSTTDRFGELVGSSVAMRRLFATLERAAASSVTVLLLGETGTGKEAAAASLHAASPRREHPFVVVDCAALPAALLESELFGHEKGSFTGASSARDGAIMAAQGGTVFFDEIGELPLDLQPKLLRVLERREIKRVGGAHYHPVNVRFVAATHRDLRYEVNERRFRADLYYRLSVAEVRLPALRERLDDLPRLVDALASNLGASEDERRHLFDDPTLLADLRAHRWPGNVRELRNYLERGLALGAWGHSAESSLPSLDAPLVDASLPLREARLRWTASFERSYLQQLLERHQGNVSAAARAAGIDRMYFYRLLWRHELK
jgi:two-component system, NtrC family, response regulator GlrR